MAERGTTGESWPNPGHVVRVIDPLAPNSQASIWEAFFIAVLRLKTHQPFVLCQQLKIGFNQSKCDLVQRINIGRLLNPMLQQRLFKFPCQLIAIHRITQRVQ